MRGGLSRLRGPWAQRLFVLWVVVVYLAYFWQFDFYLAHGLRLIRRIVPLVAVQL